MVACNSPGMLWWVPGEYPASAMAKLMLHVLCTLHSKHTCTHRALRYVSSLKSLIKSPHDRNCFRLLPRVPPGSILEVLAKWRTDLRFWWCLCCSAAICAKRRPYAITQNIDGKFDLQYTTSLARSRGPVVSREPQWASIWWHLSSVYLVLVLYYS